MVKAGTHVTRICRTHVRVVPCQITQKVKGQPENVYTCSCTRLRSDELWPVTQACPRRVIPFRALSSGTLTLDFSRRSLGSKQKISQISGYEPVTQWSERRNIRPASLSAQLAVEASVSCSRLFHMSEENECNGQEEAKDAHWIEGRNDWKTWPSCVCSRLGEAGRV